MRKLLSLAAILGIFCTQSSYAILSGLGTHGVVIECPTTSQSDCAAFCYTAMPELTSTQMTSTSNLHGIIECNKLGISASASICCYGGTAFTECPSGTISPISQTILAVAHNISWTSKSTTYSGSFSQYYSKTIKYYDGSATEVAYCMCGPEYYGSIINPYTTSSASCTKCPCIGSACGTVYNASDLYNSSFVDGVIAGNFKINTITACRVKCTENDNCRDDFGQYIHTNYCSYSN